MNHKHLNHVESVRAIAALMVALFHFTNAGFENGPIVKSVSIRKTFEFGAQGVEMFYIISGFVITYSLLKKGYVIADYFRYLAKRIVRIIPPYFLTILGIILFNIFTAKFLWGLEVNLNIKEIIANLLFLADSFDDVNWINPIFETLKIEFQFYFLIGLIIPFIGRIRWRFAVFSGAMIAMAFITFTTNSVFLSAPYFLIGMTLFFIYDKGWDFWLGIILLGLLFILYRYYMTEDLIIVLIAIPLILFLSSRTPTLQYTGKISYSFYLIHGLSGGQFLYFTRNYDFAQQNPFVMISLAICFSWFIAAIMYEVVEKPSMKLGSKIKYLSSRQKSLNSQKEN